MSCSRAVAWPQPPPPLMFAHEFVRNAWLAGTFIALACGVIGWFVVAPRPGVRRRRAQPRRLRRGDRRRGGRRRRAHRPVRAHPGAGRRDGRARPPGPGRRRRPSGSPSPGSSASACCCWPSWPPAPAGASGITTANTLFGSIYSLSAGAAVLAAAVALAATGFVVGVARPLLLATLDPELATLRGVPGARAGPRLPRRAGRRHRREHPGGRGAAAAGADRRPGGRRRAR